MKKSLASSALVIATSAFAAGAPNLNGQWSIHNSVAGNESDQQCSFVLTDNKLSGSCKSAEGKDLPVSGSLDGKKLTWKYESEYEGSPLTMTYSATLGDSDNFSGNVDVEPFGVSGDFTATPSKDAGPTK